MSDIANDLKRLRDLAASWKEAISATDAELSAEILKEPAVAAGVKDLKAALDAQRDLTELLEVDALDRFRSNKQLDSLAASSLKDAAAVVKTAQSHLADAVRSARASREQAAVASTVSKVSALLEKSATPRK